MAAGPVDLPDAERKAHSTPTPTSGGIGIALGYTFGLVALIEYGTQLALTRQLAALAWFASVFSFFFLLIGFIDDTRPLGPRLKFMAFMLLSFAAAITMGVVDELPLGGGAEWRLGLSLGLFGTALWVFTLVNAVNFMDGANGLAMGSMAIGLLALAAIAVTNGSNIAATLCFCAAGGIAGFLVWNFPNGRIFAGDSGALFAGAVAAISSLIILARTDVSPFVPPILFMPLLADALLTLAWRVMHRRKILVAHNEHLYQIAMRSGWSHAHISMLYWAAMAVCGVIGFYLARAPNSAWPWIVLAILAGIWTFISLFARSYASAKGFDQ
jgi:UDP-N-acetylmuramyl pentapeptide phosphotransferase/UDP-N-acetylglucosamine-1-phosphate transferase